MDKALIAFLEREIQQNTVIVRGIEDGGDIWTRVRDGSGEFDVTQETLAESKRKIKDAGEILARLNAGD